MNENQEESLQCREENIVTDIFNIPTFLSLMKKYPEAREDILELRRYKNKALFISITLTAILSFGIGFCIAKVLGG